jgi:hypothetical protein
VAKTRQRTASCRFRRITAYTQIDGVFERLLLIFDIICSIDLLYLEFYKSAVNFDNWQNVVRKAERQDDDKENELMINTFLNPAPRTPAVHGGLKKKRNTDMIYIGKA